MVGVPRFRERLTADKYGLKEIWNNQSPFNEYNTLIERETDIMSDVITPGYHKLIGQGAIVNNECTKSTSSFRIISEGHYDYTKVGDRWWSKGPVAEWRRSVVDKMVWHDGNPPMDTTQLVALAKQRALSQIDSTPFAFGEDLAEMKETLQFLKSPARSLYNLATRTRKRGNKIRRVKNEIERQQVASDLYLSYRFAATPLYQSAMNAIDAYQGGQRDRLSVRNSARGYASGSQPVNGVQVVGADTWYVTSVHDVTVRASILYTHSGGTGIAFHLGLRPKDIPLTLWQIVPLSFMVDRAIDISAAIKGISNLVDPRTRVLAASYSLKVNSAASAEWLSHDAGPGFTGSCSGKSAHNTGSYTRRKWTPGIIDTVPQFVPEELVKDATNLADLFHLGSSMVSKTFSPFKLKKGLKDWAVPKT